MAKAFASQADTADKKISFVRLSDGGPARYAGPRSEVSVLTTLGQRVLGDSSPVDWTKLESHDAIRQLMDEDEDAGPAPPIGYVTEQKGSTRKR